MADDTTPKPRTVDEFLLAAGVNPDVVKANDGTLNPDQIKLLEVTHGAAVTTLYVDNVETMRKLKIKQAQEEATQKSAQVKELFKEYDVDDPEKLFNDMREWAKSTYSPEDYKELQADTRKGGRAQRAALKEIADGYLKANPMTVKVSGDVNGDTNVTVKSGYITAGDYTDQLRALQKRGLNADHADIKALNARRMASRKQEHK